MEPVSDVCELTDSNHLMLFEGESNDFVPFPNLLSSASHCRLDQLALHMHTVSYDIEYNIRRDGTRR